MSNKFLRKSISFILTLLMITSMLPVNLALAAVGDNETSPILYNKNDTINFPQYPNEGYVRINKTAEWVDGRDKDIAKITMTLDGKGVQQNTDVALVIDRSGSMSDQITINRYKEVALNFTASNVSYQYEDWVGIWIFGTYEWKSDNASNVNIRMTAYLDEDGKYVGYKAGTMSVTGFKSSDRNYRLNSSSGSFNSWTNLSNNNCANALVNIFRGKTSQVELNGNNVNVSFPTDINVLKNTTSTTARKVKKIDEAINAANKFVDALLPAGNNQSLNKIAVISYSSRGYIEGNSNQDAIINSGLTNNRTTLKNSINSIKANGGTHIQAGIQKAQEVLSTSTADSKYIIVLTDGEPTYSYRAESGWAEDVTNNSEDVLKYNYPTNIGFKINKFTNTTLGPGNAYNYSSSHRYYVIDTGSGYRRVQKHYVDDNGIPTISQALLAKKDGIEIYSVGFDVASNSDAKYVMEHIASKKDNYYLTTDDLSGVFSNIAGRFAKAGTNANITTTIDVDASKGYNFTILNNTEYPIIANLGTTSFAGNTINWTLGDITETQATLTYYVKLNITGQNVIPRDAMLDTGGASSVTYKNYNGKWVNQKFPETKLAASEGTVNVSYYQSDEDGNPVNSNGEIIPFENRVVIEGTNLIESAMLGENISVSSYVKQIEGYINQSTTAYDEKGYKLDSDIPVTRKTIYLNFPYYQKLVENKLTNNSMYANKGLNTINSGNINFSVIKGINYTFGFSFEANETAPVFSMLVKGNESKYTLNNFKLYKGNQLISQASSLNGLDFSKIVYNKNDQDIYTITYNVNSNEVGASISIEVVNENLIVNEGVPKTINITSFPMPILE